MLEECELSARLQVERVVTTHLDVLTFLNIATFHPVIIQCNLHPVYNAIKWRSKNSNQGENILKTTEDKNDTGFDVKHIVLHLVRIQ